MTAADTRKKLIILGGGCGSLSTAYSLTSEPDWRDKFESITIYQMGWRLGGKGASGRGVNGRIEEHGLHIWMGWYENAFKMMRAVYEELGRSPDTPLATWDQAFKKHGYINLGEQVKGAWTNWPIDFPFNADTPGQGGTLPTVWDVVHEALKGFESLFRGTLLTRPGDAPDTTPGKHGHIPILERFERIGDLIHDAVDIVAAELLLAESVIAAWHARTDAEETHEHHRNFIEKSMHRLRKHIAKHLEERIEGQDEERRLFYIMDTCLTCIAGVMAEGCGHGAHAFDVLDQYDFREFLRKHGAEHDTVNSPLIAAFYQLLFAYKGGDWQNQLVGAGVALRFIFRMTMTYKGAIFWKMQAGMGDTIFAPIYEVLRRRGVRFEFFHRVRELELSADGTSVAKVHIGRQATLVDGEYDPFVVVNDLPCWPSTPRYEQLVEGAELEAEKIDLESMWSPWVDRETPTELVAGADYDTIVFGISLASIPYVAPQLVAARPRWQAMLANIETVRTLAVQLWLRPDLAKLGWPVESAVTDAYPEPLDTWADMSQLIARESWPAATPVGNITYFCAPMPGGITPLENRDAPKQEAEKVRASSIAWLNEFARICWPSSCDPADNAKFDWSLLIAPASATGEARFDSQYWRANIDPSERYVLSVPGSTLYRLHADDPDFDNLFLTGDWTYTGVNAGCVEGTVMSGMLTARAITGSPRLQEIIGYATP
jgi:uncharacterized protein with NAD-binding domain and iron-sulfur cluster